MRTLQERWEQKGRRVPIIIVIEQGRIQLSLAEEHAEPLGAYGWQPEKTVTLKDRITALEESVAQKSSAVDASKDALRTERLHQDDAQNFVDKLRTAVPLVLKNSPDAGVTDDAFKIGEPLNRRTSRYIKYFIKVRPFVETFDAAMTPYFGGKSALAELDGIKSDLVQAETAQESGRAVLPSATHKALALAGEVHDLIDEVNRVAKLAFREHPEIASLFNKALIRRARNRGPNNGNPNTPNPGPSPSPSV